MSTSDPSNHVSGRPDPSAAPGDAGAAGAPAGSQRKRLRWAVPGVAAAAVAAAFVVPSALSSTAADDVPPLTADELVARMTSTEPVPISGTVVYTARLGLPDVTVGGMTGAGPLDLLGGSSTVRVWSDGAERSRAALLGDVSEYSVVKDGAEAWTYSSADDEAVHYTVPADRLAEYEDLAEGRAPEVQGDVPTPTEAADLMLTYARTTTDITVLEPTEVAGRSAYQLELDPQTDGTLVDRALVAVDAETAVPLRVQVWSTQDASAPAMEVGFTDVSFDAPDDSVFDFTPPAGAEVRDVEVPLPEPSELGPKDDSTADAADHGVSVAGTGWETVVELTGVDVAQVLGATAAGELPDVPGESGAEDLMNEFTEGGEGEIPGIPELDTTALYDQLTTEVDGGRVLSSALLSVLVTDDGTVYAGAVPTSTLTELAAG
ncbi:LolA family protein [Paraoerskovia sediminicola]|nr:DUF2092 domain-containing protein [Paraoerskovia sediminicola]